MPHSRPEDLPAGGGGRWPYTASQFRSEQWGDLEVGYTVTQRTIDSAEVYEAGGMPGGVCACPHYGYVFEGRIRAVYPGSGEPDEIVEAGEAYFFPGGHVLHYEPHTVALEFNPAHPLQRAMDFMNRGAEAMARRFGAASPDA